MIEKTDNPNLAILEIAVEALGDLSDSLVFVGGCANRVVADAGTCQSNPRDEGC
jgi:hypothetical protein